MNEQNYSPLRYPGGKARLYNSISSLVRTNKLKNYTYAEAYAGGSGLALALLINGDVKRIILNDLDRSIYAFWHCVLNETENLIKMIMNVEVTLDEWNKQKSIQNEKENVDLLSLGFSTLFLNRTNRSGILAAGVIGGNEQNGNYLIDCRFNKVELVRRIANISKFKFNISIFQDEAIDFMKKIASAENLFIYLDPPYVHKGPELYMNFYKIEDHENLQTYLNSTALKYIVSYDDCSEIRKIYKKYKYRTYTLNHSVSNKGTGKEIMFFSPNMVVPNVFYKIKKRSQS